MCRDFAHVNKPSGEQYYPLSYPKSSLIVVGILWRLNPIDQSIKPWSNYLKTLFSGPFCGALFLVDLGSSRNSFSSEICPLIWEKRGHIVLPFLKIQHNWISAAQYCRCSTCRTPDLKPNTTTTAFIIFGRGFSLSKYMNFCTTEFRCVKYLDRWHW